MSVSPGNTALVKPGTGILGLAGIRDSMKLFAKKPTVKEQVRTSQRDIGRSVRDIEKEVLALKREEQKLIKEIKQTAAKGNTAGAKQLAKSLIRLRGQEAKLQASMGQLRGVKTSIATAAATATVGNSMATASAAMASVGQAANPAKMQQTMQQFAKENAKMDMASEMMGDAVDDALDDDEVEDETDDLMNQVLDEIGVDIHSKMATAPRTKVAHAQQQADTEKEDAEADDLIARLSALK